ncbi:DivIVA domain-containing protein [Bifidobacterium saguinibicoloris]|uniref:DivIVA domain-containing protein n=1 Tax=Bifidobacterium saguinibicoloris TaxID=2834433 RepID=UPI001C55FE38|nr:DivIVA domain-containing protein [Bifidobacterium saguinibicoloris]MBW3080429.1 DivIVA domain-containing protein [Bifidobacterium saguinibicoloris]
MAQQSEAGIPKAGKRKWGYDPAQVDAFLERAHALYDSEGAQLTQRDIQNVSFDLTRGGYVIAQVDAALARLERAVVDKQTTWEISQHGRVAWKAQTEELYREIARHADRGAGERFGSGKPRVPSYDRKQVDKLTDQIVDKCAADLDLDGVSRKDVKGLENVTAEYVANAVFTQRKGKKGYDERQVDYFLNSCVELLSRLESFERIADYLNADGTLDADAAPASAAKAEEPARNADGVAPLFPASTPRPAAPVQEPSQGFGQAASSESFDALSQAEQHLFSAPAAQTPSPAVSVQPAASATPSFLPKPGDVPSFASAPASPIPASTPAPEATPSVQPSATAPAAVPPSFTPTASATRPVSVTPIPVTSAPAPSMPAPSVMPTTSIDVSAAAQASDSSLAALSRAAAPTVTPAPVTSAPAFPAYEAPKAADTPFSPAPVASPSVTPATTPSVSPSWSLPTSDVTSTPAAAPTSTVTSAAAPAPSTPSAGTQTRHAAHAAHTDAPFSLLSTTSNDLEIPDLSFPTLTLGNANANEKKQQ